MKKFLFAAAAIVCALLLSVNLTSCGDDKSEPDMTIQYYVGGSTDNDYSYFPHETDKAAAQAVYEGLLKELKTIITGQEWSVKYNNSNRDEVIKREDEAAKKKYSEMETKLMAFKNKVDNLDKTQGKNKFAFGIEVTIACKHTLPTGTTTLESRTISIKYNGDE